MILCQGGFKLTKEYNFTDPYEIAKFIKDAEKSTPVKAYIKGIEMSSSFSFLIPQVIAMLLFILLAYIVSVFGLMFHVKKIEA